MKSRKSVWTLIAFGALLVANARADAATSPSPIAPVALAGTRDIGTFVSISDRSGACNVTSDEIIRSAKYVFASSPFRLFDGAESLGKPIIWFDVILVYEPTLRRCSFALDTYVTSFGPGGQILDWGVVLMEGFGPSTTVDSMITRDVEDITKAFIVDLADVQKAFPVAK